jgi:hypothetical protein
MTTIFWNGKELIADSRRTQGRHHHDNAVKIVRVEDCIFSGKKVLLMAGAGAVELIEGFYRVFLKDPDKYKDAYKLAYKTARDIGTNTTRCSRSASIIVVTDDGAYMCSVGTSETIPDLVLVDTPGEDGHSFVTLGSGGQPAATLVRLFNVPPVLAVAAAGLMDKRMATGGTVVSVTLQNDGQLVETSRLYKSTTEIHDELRVHMGSIAMRYLGVHGSTVVKTLKGKKEKRPESEPTKSSSGNASCVTADSIVLLADGTHKKVKDVKIGDKLAVEFPSWYR